jgi:hypothetical protein
MESVKGLREKVQKALGLSDEDVQRLQEMRAAAAMQQLFLYGNIISRGGNIHGRDRAATEKRRKANKAARTQRRTNRQR